MLSSVCICCQSECICCQSECICCQSECICCQSECICCQSECICCHLCASACVYMYLHATLQGLMYNDGEGVLENRCVLILGV